MKQIIQQILKRRSIRRYTAQPVDRQTLTALLQAAMAAPSACDSQPWEFIVVTDAALLDRLQENLRTGRYHPPAAIAICGNPEIAHNAAGRRFWVQDCSAAAENILLAASGLGLGAVWVGIHPLPSLIRRVSEILALPENVIPLCLIYVGYPAEEKPPRTRYDSRRVHWNTYKTPHAKPPESSST